MKDGTSGGGKPRLQMTITGTLEEIKEKLQIIRAIIEYRRLMGWKLFQDDENWDYETADDERVCQYCRMYESMREFIGSSIPITFRYWSRLGQNTVYPDVHSMPEYSFLHGECRCRMTWDDYLYVLRQRLFKEFEESV